MYSLRYYLPLLVFSSGTAMAGTPPPANPSIDPSSDQARIRRLEDMVAHLMWRVADQEATLKEQQQALKDAAPDNSPNSIHASTNGRSLEFKSNDGQFAMQLGGRLQVDSGFYDARIDSGDGTDIRRLFIDVRGQVYENWLYRFQYDFARSGTNDANRGIRDAWIAWQGTDAFSLRVGQFKAPFGLEHLMSSMDSTFMERGLPFLFSPDRRIGLGAEYQQNRWTAALGGFGGTAEEQPNDSQAEDEGWNLIGRVTALPWQGEDSLIHTGVAFRQHWVNDEDGSVRFRERPEINLDGSRLIDTGSLSHIDTQQSVDAELAGQYGPWSMQGEYVHHTLQRHGGYDDADFSSWYGFASVFLTPGDHRSYKKGVFSRIEPTAPVNKGGWGAIELAARYSTADLNDKDILGGEMDDFTLGINWYATNNIRFIANYVRVLDVDRPGSSYDDTEGNIIAFRGQIDF